MRNLPTSFVPATSLNHHTNANFKTTFSQSLSDYQYPTIQSFRFEAVLLRNKASVLSSN